MGDDILVYLQHKAYQALTAGAVEPVSDLHSMTGKLVKFLREGIPGHEPPLTFNDIAHHIQQTIHRETRGKQTPEFGNLLGSGKGQMVFLPPGKFKFYPEKPGIKNEPIPIQGELPQEPLETLIGKLVGIKFPEESPPKPREPVPILQQLPPPFVWCDIPKGEVTLEGGVGKFEIKPFKIAKYPITYGQFETFMTDSKGFNRLMWWDGLSEVKKMDHPQKWKVKGYPRENVSWFAAVAFCRWLSYQVGYEVRLPTEWEWQWAAQGPDGLVYPWGNEFDKTLANTREGVGGGFLGLMKWTTPVDQYPKGESPFGVGDMAGNVMEWCLNDYDNPTNTSTSGLSRRAVRGGSWRHNQDFARCARRDHLEPGNYNTHTGFRIASSST